MEGWRLVLVVALTISALVGLGYRVYRYTKKGPIGDVLGQAVLAVLLLTLAGFLAGGAGWPRWVALGYASLFALIVMPVWVLAVLLPLRPGPLDYAFTAVYWVTLLVIAVAALAL